MTDITTYPLEDWFETTLSQVWNWAVWTIYVNATPSFTFPAWVTTYIIVDPWKSTMQLAEINGYNPTLKTMAVSNITLDKWAGVAYTQQSHQIGAKVRISHNYQFWKDIVDAINTKVNTNDDDIAQWKFADATARDAYFTSPVNGNSAYLTAEGKWTDYVSWSWADRASGTNPNASETVAGRVEIATQAEFDAWTATGWTWASVVATNDQIRKQISTATAKTTPVNADSIGISDSAASWVIKKTTLTQLKAASDMQATTTTSWFVEMATDAEVATWTDETRYINSKQNKRNVDRITGTRTWSSTGSQTITHTLGKAPTFIFAIANTNSFYLSSVGMWCSEWNSAIWDFSSAVAIGPSLSNSALINFWNIWSDRSLNCSITSVNTTDIVLNRSTIWSWWTIYDVGYTFFVYW